MNISKDEILATFPERITLENIRCILKVSKKKAAWLLQNGIIKCEISKNQTWKYNIQTSDFLEFLSSIEKDGNRLTFPKGQFSSQLRKTNDSQKKEKSVTIQISNTVDFRTWLTKEWKNEKNALYNTDIANITGYPIRTVNNWILRKQLKSSKTYTKCIVAKEWLIDFYCEYSTSNKTKSLTHISLLNKYLASINKS